MQERTRKRREGYLCTLENDSRGQRRAASAVLCEGEGPCDRGNGKARALEERKETELGVLRAEEDIRQACTWIR